MTSLRSGAPRPPGPGTQRTATVELIELPSRLAAIEAAEQRILARLRRADRSRAEVLRELLGAEELDAPAAGEIIERLERFGYLDDHRMALALAHRLAQRKGMGRSGIRRELQARALDAEAIDDAVASIADGDEFERALAFARSRSNRMHGLETSTALRRLLGALQRRGFSGGVAMIAAQQALEAEDAGARRSGVGSATERVWFGNTESSSPSRKLGG